MISSSWQKNKTGRCFSETILCADASKDVLRVFWDRRKKLHRHSEVLWGCSKNTAEITVWYK